MRMGPSTLHIICEAPSPGEAVANFGGATASVDQIDTRAPEQTTRQRKLLSKRTTNKQRANVGDVRGVV